MFQHLRISGRWGNCLFAAGLVGVVFLVHAISPNATPFDSRWTVPTAISLLSEGDTDLDEYLPLLEANRFYAIECIGRDGSRLMPVTQRGDCANGHFYNSYPVTTTLISLPFVAALRAVAWAGSPVFEPAAARIASPTISAVLRGDLVAGAAGVEVLIASLLIAVATLLMFLVAREYLNTAGALAVALIFSFATPAWSIASRALWQHGPAMLLLAAALLVLVRANERPSLVPFLGPLLAFGYYIRPTMAGPLAVLTLYVLIYYRKQFPRYALLALPVVLAFQAHTCIRYGVLVAPYSNLTRENLPGLSLHGRFLEALSGNLISPSRGLLVFVPIALLAIYGMFLRPREGVPARLRPFLVASIVLHWIGVSTYEDWWAGHSFGPRYMSEITPFLIWFLIPVLERATLRAPARRLALTTLLILLALPSLWINYRGAWCWATYEWNVSPVEIHESQQRLWDWKDPQFLRGL